LKTRFFALAVALATTGAPASAATYTYASDAYTLNVDPTIYGTRMTGSVTFNQDTSNFTGIIYIASGTVTALNLTSGDVSATLPYFDIFANPASPYFSTLFFPGSGFEPDYFKLVNGNIEAWLLHGVTPSFLFSDWLVAPSYQLYSQGDHSITAGFGFDNIQSNFPTGTTYASRFQSMTAAWTPVAPVPIPAALPLFAAGLGMIAFFARRKKPTADRPA
jgi:hypothetical protein